MPKIPTGVVANEPDGVVDKVKDVVNGAKAAAVLAMATLTKLESKLAEVLGLAMASQEAVGAVTDMLDDDKHELTATLEQMRAEARETQKRVTELAGTFDRKKTTILTAAKETKAEAVEMMETYLEGEDDALDGFEFLHHGRGGRGWSLG